MPTYLIESALVTSSILQFQIVFLNLLTLIFILHSCHILFTCLHMAASWALRDGKKQKTLLLVLHFTRRKNYLSEKFIRCVFGWYSINSMKRRTVKNNRAGKFPQSQWALGTGNNSLKTEVSKPR